MLYNHVQTFSWGFRVMWNEPYANVAMLTLQFPPRFAAGDVGSAELDLKLPNSVFNTLKQHSYREERQSARIHEKKEHATHVRKLF